jgi:cystathionine beta-lyase
MKTNTRLVHYDASPKDPFSPAVTPIYQTATFEQPSAVQMGPYDYTRSDNPTRSVLDDQLALLSGARNALTFSSGMAAISTVARLVESGGEIIASDDLYGGTYRLLTRILPRQGIKVRHVDTSDLRAVAAAFRPTTRLLLVETPSNPLQRIADIAALAQLAHERGARLAVDNTFLTPYLQKPLKLGADLEIQSCTKYLCGHSDVTAGVVATNDQDLADELAFIRNAEGTALAPFESWLLLRGLKTLSVRMDRQQANAARIVEFLSAHPAVTKVYYPGLARHPGHKLHFRQARGAGAVVCFETGSAERSARFVERTSLFAITVSFGSVCSLASLPGKMSHASIPEEVRAGRCFPQDLVRLSIGIEDSDDLIHDLREALECAGEPSRAASSPAHPVVTADPARKL